MTRREPRRYHQNRVGTSFLAETIYTAMVSTFLDVSNSYLGQCGDVDSSGPYSGTTSRFALLNCLTIC